MGLNRSGVDAAFVATGQTGIMVRRRRLRRRSRDLPISSQRGGREAGAWRTSTTR